MYYNVLEKLHILLMYLKRAIKDCKRCLCAFYRSNCFKGFYQWFKNVYSSYILVYNRKPKYLISSCTLGYSIICPDKWFWDVLKAFKMFKQLF